MSTQAAQAGKVLTAIPYLRVRDGAKAIDFYKQIFDAEEIFRLGEPGGKVGHAELKIGASPLMLSGEYPEHGIHSPLAFNGTGSMVHLQVDNVDAIYQRALAAGATSTMEPADQFYGMRMAKFRDPFGHEWGLGQAIEQVSNDEIQQRFKQMMSGT